jgi:hypothetical protein
MQVDASVGVYGACGDFQMRTGTWLSLLTVARQYGWVPAGTDPPENWGNVPSEWDGAYFPPSGQLIAERDSKAFARALNKALPDVPDSVRWDIEACHRSRNTLEELSGPQKHTVIALIEHCYVCSWDDLSLITPRSS